jgi:hypothetical protein
LHQIGPYNPNSRVSRAARRKKRRVVKILMRSLRRRRPPQDEFLAGRQAISISQNGGSRARALRSLAHERDHIVSDTNHPDPAREARALATTGWLKFHLRNHGPWSEKLDPPPPRDPDPDVSEPVIEFFDYQAEWRISSGLASGPPPKIKTPARGLNQEPALTRSIARCRVRRDVAEHKRLSHRYSSRIANSEALSASGAAT